MRKSRILHAVIATLMLLFVASTQLQTAGANNNQPNHIVVNANCLAMQPRTYPAATLPASFFQWEDGEYYFDQHFIPEQVILSGTSVDIDYLLSNYPAIAALLTPIANSNLDLANQHEMVLYGTSNVYSTLMQIYNVLDQENLAVMAEPNRFVANPWGISGDPWGISGDPWGISGDPWGISGDPWGISGDPWGISGDSLLAQERGMESRIMPLNQWALRSETGIGLLDSDGNRMVNMMGRGTDVFVFDTTPYQMQEAYKLYGSHVCNYQSRLPVELGAPHDRVKEHGLFAAGLVKMVAPYSDVHLVRALNEAGYGDVFSVVAVMQDALMEQHQRGMLDSTLFNLSLSITNFSTQSQAGQQLLHINQRINALEKRLPSSYRQHVLNNDPIPALHQFVTYATDSGITIVAATGNDSAGTQQQVAGLPAAYDRTIGVAASNAHREFSCFSNAPEKGAVLLAPGGDGIGKRCLNPLGQGDFHSICGGGFTSVYDCEFTIMSATSGGYGQWLGTSFSTPLAAGVAALLQQHADDIGCRATPALLKYVLITSAEDYGGILNVQNAVAILEQIC